ncbi:hypothetical protein [Paludisphaera soli]|uniref:hypothetical protein n=1 Tax=Paludisphaera soli TaxID=2712865 RepID=UPI0013EB27FF|nr:hypothetical protein [Paludisphaera soli]
MARRNAGVKFFLEAQKAIATVTVKRGRIDVGAAQVFVESQGRRVDAVQHRKVNLGGASDHVVLVVIVPYYEPNGDVLDEPKDPDILGVTANLKVTITNTPPAGEPEEVVIDETDSDAEDLPGDDPDAPTEPALVA